MKLPTRQAVVFELDRLAEYSDDAILDELRRVADIAPNGPLTTRLFQRHSRVSFGTVTRRFGSWDKALMAAGLSERWLGSRAAKLATTKSITDEVILEALADLALRLGKTELTWRDVTAHLPFNGNILKKRWGSVSAAFEAAGLSSTNRGRRYTDEECFENMLEVWTHHGRPPRVREMSELPSKVGATPYMERFGTWKKALTAFVERANSDLDILASDTPTVGAAPLVAEQLSTAIQESGRDKRGISLGVRFQVLNRDRFKCVLCGDSPSSNPTCVLHVDHIIPWSKGGRTSIENLRSLCGSCNIGRGNRYDD
ncbi:MAG TPA: HNH endonuclease [Herbaspirillum sp.]|nr:HNH endonuclease [Herbaspirillum sp.]